MRYYLLVVALAVALFMDIRAKGSWGPGGCAAVAAPVAVSVPEYQWIKVAGRPSERALLHRGVHVASYDFNADIYREYRDGVWSDPMTPPWRSCPCLGCKCRDGEKCSCGDKCSCDDCPGKKVGRPPVEAWQVEGVDHSRIRGGENCCVNGQRCSKAEALAAIEAAKIPTDQNLLRLTVVSADPATRQKVRSDLASAPELSGWKDKLVVQDYAPDHWRAKLFEPKGPVSLIVEAPSGEVLARQDDYSDGPSGLVKNLEDAQRRYDPTKPQDARSSDLLTQLQKYAEENPMVTLFLVAGVLYLIFRKK